MIARQKFQHTDTKIYLIVWISSVLYANYKFIIVSGAHFKNYYYDDRYHDFTLGWPMLGLRQKDKSDFEWETTTYWLNHWFPLMLFYITVFEILRLLGLKKKLYQYFQIVFTLTFLTHYFGWKISSAAILQPVLFALILPLNNHKLVWFCNILCLVLREIYKKISASEDFIKSIELNYKETYISFLLLCWMNLKCTSFCLNHGKSRLDCLAYSLYFPTIFTGPFISYEKYAKMYESQNFEPLDTRLIRLAFNLQKLLFWFVFVEVCLHFIYINATALELELVQKLDFCSLCGYGYLMGQFFHIKYVVLYGFSTSLASFEHIQVPSLPRCIGRVHLYSDMWRYFDPGIYDFLKTCIYIPMIKTGSPKLLASLICFLFVYIWHGVEDYILIWAILNFIGVTFEELVKELYKTRIKKLAYFKNMPESHLRVAICVISAPLLVMSAISNFYFFAGKDVGDIFVNRVLHDFDVNKILLLLTMYCCCQVSTELKNVSAKTM